MSELTPEQRDMYAPPGSSIRQAIDDGLVDWPTVEEVEHEATIGDVLSDGFTVLADGTKVDFTGPWLPDGHGLDPYSLELLAEHGGVVHLRLASLGRHPRTACDAGLGEWWTGKPAEVTCSACLAAGRA